MDTSEVGVVTLELKLLGGLELHLGAAPLKLRYPSAGALLAYLAVSQRPHTRDTLAETFWGELSAPEAKANLRRVLSSLRQDLGAYLELDGNSVRFKRDAPYTLDVERFRTLLQGGDGLSYLPVTRLEAALTLYHGDFLTGFTLPAAPDFDDWSLEQLEGLKELALAALRALTTQHLVRRHDEAAVAALHRIIALDPWSEEACRQLLVLLGLSEQWDAALSEFRRYETRLDELGERPSRAMVELVARLRGREHVADLLRLPRHNLEVAPTALLGREALLTQAAALLTRPTCRLLTLTGPGGVGKTRLSQEVGWQVVGGFKDGVFFIPLAPVSDPELVPSLVTRALGLEPKGTLFPAELLKGALRQLQVLLILDNFEQVTRAAPLVAELLSACPQLKVMVTSRVPLKLRGEQEVDVPPLSIPPLLPQARLAGGDGPLLPLLESHKGDAGAEDPDALLAYPSVALFCERTREVRTDFALSADNAPVVAQICRRLDGLPLALELAAARGKLFPPEALLARLNNRLGLLSHGPADLPERHRTLRATLAWSFELLTAGEQQLFRRLGVTVGSCDLALASAFGDDEDDEVLETLSSLLDKSLLLRVVPEDGEPRVMMLETVREYAVEKLNENPQEAQTSRQRHAEFFSELLGRLYLPLVHADREARRTTERELENIRAAWLWAVAQREVQTLTRMALALGRAFETRPLEAAALFAQAAAGLDDADPEHRVALGYVCVMEAWLFNSLGQPERALELVERGLELLEPLAEYPGLCKALSVKAWNLWFYHSRPHEAKRLWEASLALAREHGVGSAMGEPLAQLIVVELGLGTFAQVKNLADRTLPELAALGDHMQYTKVLCWSGTNLSRNGFLAEGLKRIREAVGLARTYGLGSFLPVALGDAAEASYRCENDEEAEAYARECVAVAAEKGIRYAEARGLNYLGRVMAKRGEQGEAQRYLGEALAKAWEAGDLYGVTATLVSRAELSTLQGDLDHATAWLALVVHHERTEKHVRKEAQARLDILSTLMAPQTFIEAAEGFKQVQLEALVRALLS